MERQITILDSETQSKHVINTSATTFGQLKELVRQAGVDITDKDWLEGFTKTSPRDDSSILPTNVPYKGQTTNNLVYMLTKTGKKTESGLDRKAIYEEIRKYGLADDIKYAFGENYTRLKSDVLEDYIEKYKLKSTLPDNVTKEVDNYGNALVEGLARLIVSLDLTNLLQEKMAQLTPKNVELSTAELNDLFK